MFIKFQHQLMWNKVNMFNQKYSQRVSKNSPHNKHLSGLKSTLNKHCNENGNTY